MGTARRPALGWAEVAARRGAVILAAAVLAGCPSERVPEPDTSFRPLAQEPAHGPAPGAVARGSTFGEPLALPDGGAAPVPGAVAPPAGPGSEGVAPVDGGPGAASGVGAAPLVERPLVLSPDGAPTAKELDEWVKWDAEVGPEEDLLVHATEEVGTGELPGLLGGDNPLERAARAHGMTLERALVIRERVYAVVAERARQASVKAMLASLRASDKVLPRNNPSLPRIHQLVLEAEADVRAASEAKASRGAYGDAWVDAILSKEVPLARAYEAAMARAEGRAAAASKKDPGPAPHED